MSDKPIDFKPALDFHTLYVESFIMNPVNPRRGMHHSYPLRVIDELWTKTWEFPMNPHVIKQLKANGEASYTVRDPHGFKPDLLFQYRIRRSKHADMMKLKNV